MKNTLVLLLLLCSVSAAHGDSTGATSQLCVTDIHAVLRDMTATLAEHKVRIEDLQTRNKEQAAKLDELRRLPCPRVGAVAFSASLVASGEINLGPSNTHTDMVFKNVVTNIGNAYSPETGFFTAPFRGAYHFEFHISGPQDSTTPSSAFLVKNGEPVVNAYEHQRGGYNAVANGVTLLLEAGDVVSLRLWSNSRIYDNANHHTTFSGHLLFPMWHSGWQ